MARKLYVPVVVDYYRDVAVVEACAESPWCEILWVRLLAEVKARETNGAVSRGIAMVTGVPQWQKRIDTLVRVGLLVVDGDGWRIRTWLVHNLPPDEIARRREDNAERVRRHREKEAAKRSPRRTRNAPVAVDVTPDDTHEKRVSNDACNALQTPLPLSKKNEVLPSEEPPNPPRGHRARNPALDALARVSNPDIDLAQVSPTAWRSFAKALADLRVVAPNVTPAEIADRRDVYRRKHPTWACTAAAVVKHWADLAPTTPTTEARPGRWVDGGDPNRTPMPEDAIAKRWLGPLPPRKDRPA